jgi:hypothetical protein
LEWKDTLLPGASRVPVAVGTPGSVADYYGTPVGQYGANPFFGGRGSALQAAAPGGALGSYEGSSSSQLQALLRALQSLTSLDAASLSGALGGGGLKIAE